MVKKKIKKKVSIRKDHTILVIVALVIVGLLLFNYSNVPTGEAGRVVVEKKLTYPMSLKNSENMPIIRYYPENIDPNKAYRIELVSITSDGDAVVSVDGSDPQVAWWGGCADEQGTWITSEISGGMYVRVCSASYDMQEADLDFRL